MTFVLLGQQRWAYYCKVWFHDRSTAEYSGTLLALDWEHAVDTFYDEFDIDLKDDTSGAVDAWELSVWWDEEQEEE